MLAAVHWARVPRVVLPDRALCLHTFVYSLLTVNKPPPPPHSTTSNSPDSQPRPSSDNKPSTSYLSLCEGPGPSALQIAHSWSRLASPTLQSPVYGES